MGLLDNIVGQTLRIRDHLGSLLATQDTLRVVRGMRAVVNGSQYELGLVAGTLAGQLLGWDGSNWAATAGLPTSPSAGQLVFWNGSAWVGITAPTTTGQRLSWTGSAWAPDAAPTATGQLAYWNGSAWVQIAAPTGAGQVLEWTGTAWNATRDISWKSAGVAVASGASNSVIASFNRSEVPDSSVMRIGIEVAVWEDPASGLSTLLGVQDQVVTVQRASVLRIVNTDPATGNLPAGCSVSYALASLDQVFRVQLSTGAANVRANCRLYLREAVSLTWP